MPGFGIGFGFGANHSRRGVSGVANATQQILADRGAVQPYYGVSTSPSALYSATLGKTIHSAEEWVGSVASRALNLYAHDPATNIQTGPFLAFTEESSATGNGDPHGVLAVCEDYQNNIHAFGGTHNQTYTKHASTSTAGDFSTLTQRTNIPNGRTDYPKPYGTSAGIDLIIRWDDNTSKMFLSRQVTTALNNGVPTWGARYEMIDPGANLRAYAGNVETRGNERWIPMTLGGYATETAQGRTHQFVFILDVTTGAIRNLAGTTTVPKASQPITELSPFKVFDSGTTNATSIPAACFDDSGNYHLVFTDGASGGSTFNVTHMGFNSSTGAQIGSNEVLGATSYAINNTGIANVATVGLEVMRSDNSNAVTNIDTGNPFVRGGDIKMVQRPTGGSSTTATIVRGCTRHHALDGVAAVSKADPRFRWRVCEIAQQNTTGDADVAVNGGDIRIYGYGSTGGLGVSPVVRDYAEEAEVTAAVARMTVTPSDTDRRRYNYLIRLLKSTGRFGSSDLIYIQAAHDRQAARINWAQNAYDATEVGTQTFTAYRGFTGDGTTGYRSTGFIPASAPSPKVTLNSLYASGWCLTDKLESSGIVGSDTPGDTFLLIPRNATNSFTVRANDATSLSQNTVNSSLGHHAVMRRGAAVKEAYRNGSQAANATTAPTALPTGTIVLGRHTTVFSTRTDAFATFGAAGTEAFINQAIERLAVRRYLLEVGALP